MKKNRGGVTRRANQEKKVVALYFCPCEDKHVDASFSSYSVCIDPAAWKDQHAPLARKNKTRIKRKVANKKETKACLLSLHGRVVGKRRSGECAMKNNGD